MFAGTRATIPPMAKSDSQRGPFGAWLVHERKSRPGKGRDGKMTAGEVRAMLIRDRGFGIGESAYAELESGTALPSDEQRRHLEALWDSQAPAAHGSSDVAVLVATIGRLVAALERSEATNREVLQMLVAAAAVPGADTPTGSEDPSETVSPSRR